MFKHLRKFGNNWVVARQIVYAFNVCNDMSFSILGTFVQAAQRTCVQATQRTCVQATQRTCGDVPYQTDTHIF